MRKILLLFSMLVFGGFQLHAQTFTVTPSPVVVDGLSTAPFLEASSKIKNNTNADLALRWERIIVDAPAEWQIPICDNITCWAPAKSSSDITLTVGEEGDMKPTFRPNGVEGTGIVTMRIYNPADSINTVQEHTYTCNALLVDVETPEQIDFKVYPNPATNFLVLPESNTIGKAVLYNIAGKQVRIFDLSNSRRVDVADLMRGTYLLQFLDKEGATLHTTRITKR